MTEASADELRKWMDTLASKPPCERHGRDFMVICLACDYNVRCKKCNPISCQCWNDE